MTQPLPWEKNAAVPVPPAPEPVPLDAYTAPAAPEPELVPLDIYDAPAPAPKPIKPLVDIDSLNPAQREAVLSTEGPLLVLAGAGSGKTRVLTFRIAHMLGDLGVKPWQVLAITFTNKAAAEMRERLAALIPSGTRGMWVCTFHAMCVRMLREDADLLGYTGQFTIYDDDDSKRMVRDIMQALGIEQKQFPINMIRSKISSAKNAMIGPEDMLKSADSPNDKKAAQVYLELERRLRPYLEKSCREHGLSMMFFMLTNIIEESTRLMCYGESADMLVEDAFGRAPKAGTIWLKGVVSRKKQLIPAFIDAISKEAGSGV